MKRNVYFPGEQLTARSEPDLIAWLFSLVLWSHGEYRETYRTLIGERLEKVMYFF